MTPEEFTKHVGATTFAEAVDVTLRTKAQDEDTIEQQFNTIKTQSRELAKLRTKNEATEGAPGASGSEPKAPPVDETRAALSAQLETLKKDGEK